MVSKTPRAEFWAKLFFSLLVAAIGFIPTWFFLVVRYFLAPEGFWQNFLLLGGGLYFLGVIQILFLVFWLWVLVIIWTS